MTAEQTAWHDDETPLSSLIHNVADRGFPRYEFNDRYGEACSLQESSLATEGAIWFGVNDCDHRMHLTRLMVAELLPILVEFVETGYLPRPEDKQ